MKRMTIVIITSVLTVVFSMSAHSKSNETMDIVQNFSIDKCREHILAHNKEYNGLKEEQYKGIAYVDQRISIMELTTGNLCSCIDRLINAKKSSGTPESIDKSNAYAYDVLSILSNTKYSIDQDFISEEQYPKFERIHDISNTIQICGRL